MKSVFRLIFSLIMICVSCISKERGAQIQNIKHDSVKLVHNNNSSQSIVFRPDTEINTQGDTTTAMSLNRSDFISILNAFNHALIKKDTNFLSTLIHPSIGLHYVMDIEWATEATLKAYQFQFNFLKRIELLTPNQIIYKGKYPYPFKHEPTFSQIPKRIDAWDSIQVCYYNKEGVFIDTVTQLPPKNYLNNLYFVRNSLYSDNDTFESFEGSEKELEKLSTDTSLMIFWHHMDDNFKLNELLKQDLWLVANTSDGTLLGFKKINGAWYWVLLDIFHYNCYAGA